MCDDERSELHGAVDRTFGCRLVHDVLFIPFPMSSCLRSGRTGICLTGQAQCEYWCGIYRCQRSEHSHLGYHLRKLFGRCRRSCGGCNVHCRIQEVRASIHIRFSDLVCREGKLLVSVSSDKLLKVWKLKLEVKGDAVSVSKLKVTSGVVAHSKDINCVDLAPNDTLAATGSMDKSIKLFALPSLTHQSTLTGHKRGVWSVQFSSFEKTLLSSSADTTIKMWSISDATCLRTLEGHSGSILKALYLSKSQQVWMQPDVESCDEQDGWLCV